MNTFGLEPMCWLVFKNVDGCGEGCGVFEMDETKVMERLCTREKRETRQKKLEEDSKQNQWKQGKHCQFQKID